MIKIDKSEILKYLVNNIIDKDLLRGINAIIDESIKSLKIEIDGNKISPSDAEKIVKDIQNSDKFKTLISEAVKKDQVSAKSGGGFWFGVIITGAIAYGGYDMFLERYSIDQEYAFISECVGEQGDKYKKDYCVGQLKKCLKDDKKIGECSRGLLGH
jgi:hypothetical protein